MKNYLSTVKNECPDVFQLFVKDNANLVVSFGTKMYSVERHEARYKVRRWLEGQGFTITVKNGKNKAGVLFSITEIEGYNESFTVFDKQKHLREFEALEEAFLWCFYQLNKSLK